MTSPTLIQSQLFLQENKSVWHVWNSKVSKDDDFYDGEASSLIKKQHLHGSTTTMYFCFPPSKTFSWWRFFVKETLIRVLNLITAYHSPIPDTISLELSLFFKSSSEIPLLMTKYTNKGVFCQDFKKKQCSFFYLRCCFEFPNHRMTDDKRNSPKSKKTTQSDQQIYQCVTRV